MRIQFLVKMILIMLCGLFISPVIAAEPIDRIVATVNDSIITQSELQEAVNTVKKQIASNHMTAPAQDILQKQTLDQLINRKLQLQLANEANIHVNDQDVDNAIKFVAQQNKVGVAALYQKLQEQGITQSAYRKELREELILQKLQQQEIGEKIIITPQEVDAFMNSKAFQASTSKEYHLEDIMIGLPDEPTSKQISDAKTQADMIVAKIHNGLNFHEAAMTESNGKSALEGGDLGWRKLAEIPTAFADQIPQMKKNDIIGPIKAANGYHIIHLTDIRNVTSKNGTAPQRKQVEQLVFQRKMEEGIQNWVTRLRGGAYIEIHSEKA